jgi:hypothetical protein
MLSYPAIRIHQAFAALFGHSYATSSPSSYSMPIPLRLPKIRTYPRPNPPSFPIIFNDTKLLKYTRQLLYRTVPNP